jgi:hypothetical protein
MVQWHGVLIIFLEEIAWFHMVCGIEEKAIAKMTLENNPKRVLSENT